MNAKPQRRKEDEKTDSLPSFPSHLCVFAFIFFLTILVFAQTRHFYFINVDDPQYILDNPHVRPGLTMHGIGWAFRTLRMSNWHPLTWLSHMADVTLFDVNPAGHHLVSVIIHAINACLVYVVLTFLTRSNWKSAIVAALFAVHPLRMESVAWVAERKDVLCSMFFLLAVGAYGLYARTGLKRWYTATAGAFALGILCKPMIVTLPCVLLLLDFWPLGRVDRIGIAKILLEKTPLFAMSAASAVITFIAQQKGGAVVESAHLPLAARIGNAVWAYGRYLKKTVWPNDLAAFYPYVWRGTTWVPWDKVAISGAVLIAVTAIAITLWRRDRAIMIGWLWFLGMMIPTIGLVQVGRQSMADRYSYLPHIGLLVAIVWGAGALVERWRGLVGLSAIVACAAVAIFAGCTAYQLRYWENSFTLFTHAIQVTEANSAANMCVGMYLSEQHDDEHALPYYARALRIDPDNADAHMNLANALASRGQTQAALEHVERALQLRPNSAQAQNNLANILVKLGRPGEAIEHHRKAIELDPELAQAYYNYGVTLAQLGRVREGADNLAHALRLRPDYPDARYVYAIALWTLNERDAAVAELRAALQFHPPPALRGQIEARLRQYLTSLGPPATTTAAPAS